MSVMGLLKGISTAGSASTSTSERPSSLKVERSGPSAHHGSRLRFADEVEEEPTPPSPSAAVHRSAASLSAITGGRSVITTPGVLDHQGCLRPSGGSLTSAAIRLAIETAKEESDRPGAARTIWEAAERGQTGFIVRLVERNVEYDINQRDKLMRTALHWAAECNQKATAECLLDYNADVLATECNGRTAIHLASRAGLADMLLVLLEPLDAEQREAACNQADMFGITPVFMAYQKGDDGRGVFDVLVANGGRYNQKPSKPTLMAPAAGKQNTAQPQSLVLTVDD